MLNYIITVAISAFFVPHYLGVFWEPLRTSPGDIIGGIVLIAALAALNVKGTQESARLNLVLAIGDLATQVLLVLVGLVLVLQPRHADLQRRSRAWRPTWGDFALGIALGMIAYTGIETISNMSEEAKDPRGDDPARRRVHGRRGARPLRAAADHRALGDAGDRDGHRLHDRARHDLRRRPGARHRREPRARAPA